MAIKGFSDEELLDNYDSKYYNEAAWGLAKALGISVDTAYETLEELRQFMLTKGNTENVIRSDGTIDLSKITGPGAENIVKYLKSGDVVFEGEINTRPVYVGYKNGKMLIAFGAAALPYIQMAVMPRDQNILPPVLMLIDKNVTWRTDLGLGSSEGETISITASFDTIYGETQLASPIEIGPVTSWESVTVAVVEEDIPDYATAVRYYRQFREGNQLLYRLVAKVKLDGNT